LVTPSVFEPMIFPFKRISDRVVFEMEINWAVNFIQVLSEENPMMFAPSVNAMFKLPSNCKYLHEIQWNENSVQSKLTCIWRENGKQKFVAYFLVD
jgi:hypothetical protein